MVCTASASARRRARTCGSPLIIAQRSASAGAGDVAHDPLLSAMSKPFTSALPE